MATDEELRAQQHEAERAEAAPWTDYPPTPRWYPPSVGLWAAAMTAAFTMLDGVARMVTIVVLIALEIGFLAWYRRYRGTMPSGLLRSMPTEIAGAARHYLVAITVVALLVLAAGLLGPGWLGPALALVGVTAVLARYETTYAAAAAATRARLA